MPRNLLIHIHLVVLFLFASFMIHGQDRNIQQDDTVIEAGHVLYNARKYSEAIEAYQAILKTPLRQDTKHAIRINMGQCHGKLGDDAMAIRTFQFIIEDDPNGSYATQATHQIGNLFVQRYQYKEAILTCKQLADTYPKTQTAAIAEYLIAQYFHAQGKFKLAIEGYGRFLDDYPTSPYRVSSMYKLIQLYTVQRRYVEAEALIRGHLGKNPDDADMMEKLADLYKGQGKHDKALSLYITALDRNPNDTSLRKKLGELYAEIGQHDRATEEWARIIESDPNQSNRYQQAAAIYTEHQMYEKATEAYQHAIRLNPRSSYLYIQLGGVYKIQGQIHMAIETYLQALRTVDLGYSGRDKIIEDIAEIYEGEQKQRLFDGVIAQVQEELSAEPQNANLLLSLAELYFFQGRLDLALENFRRLPRLYPTDRGRILEKYAQLLERAEAPEATRFYQAIIEVFPDTRVAWNSQMKLARLYERTGLWQEALTVLASMKGIKIDSDVQLLLGHVWLHGIHDVEAALPIYQALANRPLPTTQKLSVQLGLAECYILQEKYVSARDLLKMTVDRHIHFRAAAQKLIGDSYLYQGDFENAATEYKQVLNLSPSDSLSNDALDRILLIQSNSDYANVPLEGYVNALKANLSGQPDEALNICKDTIEAYPQALIVDDIRLLIGEIYQNRQAYSDAIEAYEQAVSEESLVAAEALTEIADIYYRQLRDATKALQTYRTLIQNYPESVIVPYARQLVDVLVKLEQR